MDAESNEKRREFKVIIKEESGTKYYKAYELEEPEEKDIRFTRDYKPFWERVKAIGQ